MHFHCVCIRKYIRSFAKNKRLSVLNNLNEVQSLSVILGHFKDTSSRKFCHFPVWVLCYIFVFSVSSIFFFSQVVHPSQLIISWVSADVTLAPSWWKVSSLWIYYNGTFLPPLMNTVCCTMYVISSPTFNLIICSRHTLSFSDLWDIYNANWDLHCYMYQTI